MMALWLLTLLGCGSRLADRVAELDVAAGFEPSLYAEIPGARSLALSPDGTVFVGTRDEGNVWAVPDADGDGFGDDTIAVATGLDTPNGVAWLDGDLYVAENTRVLRYVDVLDAVAAGEAAGDPEVVLDGLPDDDHHGWRYLAAGPDRQLYVGVGAPCNVCDEPEPYATIQRLDPATGVLTTVATGVRNTVGFDWEPGSGDLWFTDNGRDGMGDDVPPDEVNLLPAEGADFGFPGCHGADVVDPTFGGPDACDGSEPPVVELQAHVAALGMAFARSGVLPPPYDEALFVAEHGSWDRSEPVGYQVVSIDLEEATVTPFVSGWLYDDGSAWGRPVDVLELLDGSLLVSDDEAGALVRVAPAGSTSGR